MKLTYLTLFPDLIKDYLSDALINKASLHQLIEFNIVNLRDFSDNTYKSIDDKPYGGSDGQIFKPHIIDQAMRSVINSNKNTIETLTSRSDEKKVLKVFLTPQGNTFNNDLLKTLLDYDEIIFVCGRYGGFDQRSLIEHADLEISIGDYVLSGGELPALVVTEALSRFIPGVIGNKQSAEMDSFGSGIYNILESPQFTKPDVYKNFSVPQFLKSGHHKLISEGHLYLSFFTTWKKRPDLVQSFLKLKTVDSMAYSRFMKSLSDEDLKSLHINSSEIEESLVYLAHYGS